MDINVNSITVDRAQVMHCRDGRAERRLRWCGTVKNNNTAWREKKKNHNPEPPGENCVLPKNTRARERDRTQQHRARSDRRSPPPPPPRQSVICAPSEAIAMQHGGRCRRYRCCCCNNYYRFPNATTVSISWCAMCVCTAET